MIYDRRAADVRKAKELIESKVKKGIALTDAERDIIDRGTANLTAITRILSKQYELRKKLNDMGYWNTNITVSSFAKGDIFTMADFKTMISNDKMLKDAFMSYRATPNVPNARYEFGAWNDIEKILYDLENMASDVTSLYKYCGTAECGG